MSSQYDPFWQSHLAELHSLLEEVDQVGTVRRQFAGIRDFGDRRTWAGRLELQDGVVFNSQMAHMISLGHCLAAATATRTGRRYILRMDNRCLLTVQCLSPTGATPLPAASTLPATGRLTCEDLHHLAQELPRIRYPFEPTNLPGNGIYLLFEAGETGHGADRITYIGSHDVAGGLAERLARHFQPNRAQSILRKHIGEALLRARGASSALLQAWTSEHRDGHRFEVDVDTYLRNRVSLVVLPVELSDIDRLRQEAAWIRLVSGCQVCRSAENWLGRHSPKPRIANGKLWNVQHVLEATRVVVQPRVGSVSRTLIILPCSSTKYPADQPVFRPDEYESLADLLPDTGHQLQRARDHIGRAYIDSASPIQAAIDYYQGYLYGTSRLKYLLAELCRAGVNSCLILSGGYGLLLPNEPIHDYDRSMVDSRWRRAGLGNCLAEFIRCQSVTTVVGFVGQRTPYAAFLAKTNWREVGLPLGTSFGYFSPEFEGSGGAQVNVPRALGQACATYLQEGLRFEAVVNGRFNDMEMRWRPIV
jgi:hypothetical protein